MKREPGRTCLGCRRVRPRRTLVRLVRGGDGVVVADPLGTAPGRGAWVCPDDACLERAFQRGRLGHAFGKPCELGRDVVVAVRAAGRRGAGAPPAEASEEIVVRAAAGPGACAPPAEAGSQRLRGR